MSVLREKFENVIDGTGFSVVNSCEQITDDFAVKFINWFEENNRYYSLTTTELLQIFKNNFYE